MNVRLLIVLAVTTIVIIGVTRQVRTSVRGPTSPNVTTRRSGLD